MKKLMSVLIAVSLAMFFGCGGGGGGNGSGSGSTSPLAGTWDMATENGVAISGYTVTWVVNNDGSFSFTTTGSATSSTGVQCAGSGASSTSGSSLTSTYTANTCPDTGKTVPYSSTQTYSISGSTLTVTDPDGTTVTFTKQSSSSTSPLAGIWDMATQNGTAISGFTVTMVVNNDSSFSFTSTGTALSSTGAQCAGSGTSSTSGSSLTRTHTTNNCPDTGKTVPYSETTTYSISGSTLTFTNGDGSIETWTKQSSSSTSPLAGTWDMATENGTAISGYTVTWVVNNDGSFSFTTTGSATSSTGVQCAGSGTSSTSGSSLTSTYTANTCPDTGKTVPYSSTQTYSISGSTLTVTDGDGTTATYIKH